MKIDKADFVDLIHTQKLVLYLDDGTIICHEIEDRPVFFLTKQVAVQLRGAKILNLEVKKTETKDVKLHVNYLTTDDEDLWLTMSN